MRSQSHISYLGVFILSLAIVSLSACTLSDRPSSSKSSTSPSINSSPVANPSSTSNSTPTEQFTAILGSRADGWLPKVLAERGLKKGLTADAVGKIIPGAEQASEYGFSKVSVTTIPGLKQYEFYYTKDSSNTLRLESVKLYFDPALNQAYPDLVKVLSNKYGDTIPEDVEQQSIVWVGPGFVTAQLTKSVTDFGGYELSVSLEE